MGARAAVGPYRTDPRGSVIERGLRALADLGGQATVGQLAQRIGADARPLDEALSRDARTLRTVARVTGPHGVSLRARVWRLASTRPRPRAQQRPGPRPATPEPPEVS